MKLLGYFQRSPRKKIARQSHLRLKRLALALLVRLGILVLAAVVGVLVLLSFSQFHGFIFQSDFFAISQRWLEFPHATERPSLAEELEALSLWKNLEGSLLTHLKPARLERQLEGHPKVRKARVHKIFPATLRVEIEERKPVALVALDRLVTVDKEGVILERISTTSPEAVAFPFLTGLGAARGIPGEEIVSESLTAMLHLLSSWQAYAPDLYAETSEIHLDANHQLWVYLKGGTELRFGPGSPLEKMPALETFIREKGAAKGYAYIDLRMDGQVVAMPKTQ